MKRRRVREIIWSGRRDLNPRPSPWQGDALPLSYSRASSGRFIAGCPTVRKRGLPLFFGFFCHPPCAAIDFAPPPPHLFVLMSPLSANKNNLLRAGKSLRNPGLETLGFLLRLAEPLLMIAASALAYLMRLGFDPVPSAYIGFTFVGTFIFATLASLLELYTPRRLHTPLTSMFRLMGALMGAFGAVIILMFLLKTSSDFSRIWLVVWLAFSLAGMVGVRAWVAFHILRRLKKGHLRSRLAVYGTGPKATELIRRLRDDSPEIALFGVYSRDGGPLNDALKDSPRYKGGLAELLADGRKGQFDLLIITADLDRTKDADKLLNQLHGLNLSVFYCLPLPLFGLALNTTESLHQVPLVLLFRRPIEGYRLALKRLMDFSLSLLVLAVLSPLFLVLAALIRAGSPGPVFFRQKRNGFNGHEFEMLKFRSMRVGDAPTDTDGKEKQATRDDPRITTIGRFLRKTSMDELPQLINVLRGDMSLVGPRPHAVSHNTHYAELIERYASRHKMRPGMTGWAQINGLRGETDTLDKMAKRVECDIWYTENWSFALDIKIILLTPFLVLFQKQAY